MTLQVSTMRKKFLITGGSSGIGAALAEGLSALDMDVTIIGRRENLLSELANRCPNIDYVCADVSTENGRQAICKHLKNTQLSGVVHNAGIIEPMVPLSLMPFSAWQQMMATNVEAPLFLTQALQHNIKNGRVLNIGSGAAYFPIASWGGYCTSKAALSMVTRCWQMEEPDFAITSVMPGIIDSYMQDRIREATEMQAEKRDFFIRLKHENKLLTPQTVASFLCWLLLECEQDDYSSKEWDIYDSSHHAKWLKERHLVPNIDDL